MMPAYPAQFPGPLLEEDIESINQVTFFETSPDEKREELKMVAAKITAAPVEDVSALIKVRVLGNYRVVHDGTPYVEGDVLDVPNDSAHKIWIQSGWVELVKEEK